MESNLKFQFKSKKNPIIGLVLQIAISLIIIIGLFTFFEEGVLVKFSFLFFYLPAFITIEIVKVVRYNKTKNSYAILLSIESIFDSLNFIEIKWKEVKRISYKIKHVSSYLLVEMNDNEIFIKNQKWFKRPRLHYNYWKFETPFVINLEKIKGEPDVNYKKIESYIEQFRLIN